jgi:hypothetical protein
MLVRFLIALLQTEATYDLHRLALLKITLDALLDLSLVARQMTLV